MAVLATLLEFHTAQCKVAENLFIASKLPEAQAATWATAKRAARSRVEALLRDSEDLAQIELALFQSAGHLAVLRKMLAPPQSQDQFKLACATYNKDAENKSRPVHGSSVASIASTIAAWLDRDLAPWINQTRPPAAAERDRLIDVVSTLISMQTAETSNRNLLSSVQEQAVVEILERKGWRRLPSKTVTEMTALASRQFMHKVYFATTTQPQEVDIACGLGNTVALAMECKVSNDVTNSIKRINDVLKKAEAWKRKWGAFVETAALLQGVIAPKDVTRLLEAEVLVFWSHRLDDFGDWLATRSV